MSWSMQKVRRHCRYVTGWDNGPKLCGTKTQNLMDSPEGKIPICAYHAQFSEEPRKWP